MTHETTFHIFCYSEDIVCIFLNIIRVRLKTGRSFSNFNSKVSTPYMLWWKILLAHEYVFEKIVNMRAFPKFQNSTRCMLWNISGDLAILLCTFMVIFQSV